MSILASAELLMQADNYIGSGDWLDEVNSHDASISGPLFKAYSAADGRYVYNPASTGNYVATPDAVALNIVGDIDVITRIAADDYTPAGLSVINGKLGPGGNRAWYFGMSAAGKLRWVWSVDATALITVESSVATGATDGDTLWVRATMDVDNGSSAYEVKFYTSSDNVSNPDDVTWVQLGTTTTGGSTTSINAGTGKQTLGAEDGGGSGFKGAIYRGIVKSGIDGTVVFDALLSDSLQPFATFTERSSNGATVTISRGTSGLVSTVVDRNMFLFTTNDLMTITDAASLDFDETEDFTLMAVMRESLAVVGNDLLVGKGDASGDQGYHLYYDSTPLAVVLNNDGTNNEIDSTSAGTTLHTLTVVTSRRDVAGNEAEIFIDGVGTGSPDTIEGDLTNAKAITIGANSTPGDYWEGQIIAIAL